MFQFSDGIFPHRLERMNYIVNALIATGSTFVIATGIVGSLLCRTEQFDSIMSILGVFHVVGVVGVLGVVAVKFTDKFLLLLTKPDPKNLMNVAERDRLVERIRSARAEWLRWIVVLNLFFWPFLTVRHVLGSFPFMWFMLLIAFSCNVLGTLGMIRLFPDREVSTTRISQSNRKVYSEVGPDRADDHALRGVVDSDASTLHTSTVTAPISERSSSSISVRSIMSSPPDQDQGQPISSGPLSSKYE
jgi:hypothetical protein